MLRWKDVKNTFKRKSQTQSSVYGRYVLWVCSDNFREIIQIVEGGYLGS